MRIREEDRNIVLLGAVTFCCAIVAGMSALLDPVFAESNEARIVQVASDREKVDSPDASQVRVVGARFVPNVNPSQR